MTPNQILKTLKQELKGRNVAEVARRSNIPRTHLYYILTEQGNPTLSTLTAICDSMGLKLEIKKKLEIFN